MNLVWILVLTLLLFSMKCRSIDVKDISDDPILDLTSDLGTSETTNTDSIKVAAEVCSQKCEKEIQELRKNMTDLYMAFLVLHAEFAHINQHMMFHQKALKHIALMNHKSTTDSHHKNDESVSESDIESNSRNDSSTVKSLIKNLNDSDRHLNHHNSSGHHGHHQHNHHIHNHPHRKHNLNRNPSDDNKKDNKNSSMELSKEQLLTSTEVNRINGSDVKINQSIADSYDLHTSATKQSVETIQSLDKDFKQWFDNMLHDIHHSHNMNYTVVNETTQKFKINKRIDPALYNQRKIDDMENSLNSENLIFATCYMRANRHIALLSQQDIVGTINLWQLRHNRGPLHMHIKLKGFKVLSHHDHHSSRRRRRDSNLMPVEVEPEDSNGHPIGYSHSHGFHVHESGNLSRDCQSVGDHYNPFNLTHGGPYDVVRHVGDLGNIRCDRNGQIDQEMSYIGVSLSGEHSIIGKSLVIHNNADDYGRNSNSPLSSTSGSSGVRIACCLIEEVAQLPPDSDSQSSIGSVAAPALTVTTRRRRRSNSPESTPINRNRNRFEDTDLSEILKKITNYENELKDRDIN